MKSEKVFKSKGAILLASALFLLAGLFLKGKGSASNILPAEAEALSSCEIIGSGGTVVFLCRGNDGECSGKKLGYELICSGVQVIPDPNED